MFRIRKFILSIPILLGMVLVVHAQTAIDPTTSQQLSVTPASIAVWTDTAGISQLLITDTKKNMLVMLDPISGTTTKTIQFLGFAEFAAESLRLAKRETEINAEIADIQQNIDRLRLEIKNNGDRSDSATGALTQWQTDKAAFDREAPGLQKRIDDFTAALALNRDAVTKAQANIQSIQTNIDSWTSKVAEQKAISDTAKKNSTKWKADDRRTRYKAKLDSTKATMVMAAGTLTLANNQVAIAQKNVEDAQKVLDDKKAKFATYETVVAGLNTIVTQAEQVKTTDGDALKPLPDKQAALDDEKAKNRHSLELLTVVEGPSGIKVVSRNNADYLFLAAQGTKRINVFSLPSMKSVGVLGNNLLTLPSVIDVTDDKVWVFDDAGKADAAIKAIPYEFGADGVTGSMPVSFGNVKDITKVTDFAVDPGASRLFVSIDDRLRSRIDAYDLSGNFVVTLGTEQFENGAIGLELWDNEAGGFIWALDSGNRFLVFERKSLRPLASLMPRKVYFTIDKMFICPKPLKGYPAGLVIAVSNKDSKMYLYDRAMISEFFGFPVAAK